MQREITVSKEYIETVCEWLEEWAKSEKSLIIPQFLKKHGIGWSYFKSMMDISPMLHNTFEVTVAGLCSRWMLYAFQQEDVPKHMKSIIVKYLRVYDYHASFIDQEAKKELDQNARFSVNNYAIEDYSKEQLKGLYSRMYETNDKKRRPKKSNKRVQT